MCGGYTFHHARAGKHELKTIIRCSELGAPAIVQKAARWSQVLTETLRDITRLHSAA
jgi:hypothetical protein